MDEEIYLCPKRLNIVEMSILPRLMYRPNKFPIKIPSDFFRGWGIDKLIFKFKIIYGGLE